MSKDGEIADWVASSPIIDGVLFGPFNPGVEGPLICAVAVACGFCGFGKGVTQSDALGSAVGEALEQYAASQVRPQNLYRATFREIEQQAFDPRWLCLYNEDQYERPGFPYRRFDLDRPLHWTLGHWLDTSEPVYLPAFAVWLASAFDEEALCQVTSNGLAAGSSVEDAAFHATLELYERDAFLNSWIAFAPKVAIALDDLEPPIVGIIDHLVSQGAVLDVYLVSSGSPAFVAVCVGRGNGSTWPAVTFGLGASPQMRSAVKNAILEHGQTGPYLARIWRNGELPIPLSQKNIRTLRDHALYYCDPCHAQEVERWRNATGNMKGQFWHMDHGLCLDSLPPRVAVADVTPSDLDESPFRVVRALARGLQPIWYGHGFERTFTARLQALLNDHEPNLAPPPIC